MAGVYPAPLGNVGISVVDVRDIAEATAIVLTSEEHNGKTYNLNGPEAINGPKAASIWSKLLGKEIHYAGHDMDAFEEQMRKSAPSWSAFDIRMMFQGYLERGFVADDGRCREVDETSGACAAQLRGLRRRNSRTVEIVIGIKEPKKQNLRRTKCHLLCPPSHRTIQNAT